MTWVRGMVRGQGMAYGREHEHTCMLHIRTSRDGHRVARIIIHAQG